MSAIYTCITCRVGFKDADLQRNHYKSDWHRYNLKRKVAEFPPVTAEEFLSRVLLQREKEEAEAKETSIHCKYCKKTFNSHKSFDNHLNSRRHREAFCAVVKSPDIPKPITNAHSNASDNAGHNDTEKKSTNSSINAVKKPIIRTRNAGVENYSEDSDIEEISSDEWEDIGEAIPVNECLFCTHHSSNMGKNLKHMSVAHSFFIPDLEYVVDMKGLLSYLGEKIGEGYICLWCNGRGRTFYSLEAVQKHMIDKGHCKMIHEGEALAEYVDFYDYSSSYPTPSENPDEEVSVNVLDCSDYSLTLPSGAVIGHRSLMRYYRQHLNPTSVTPHRNISRLLAQYKALGYSAVAPEIIQRKARDVQFMKRVQAKNFVKLSTKANKLQHHFRAQVQF